MRLKRDRFMALFERTEQTQKEFSARSGVSRQAISSWLCGERNPKLVHVKKLASALGCKVEDIADYEVPLDNVETEIQNTNDFILNRIVEIYAKSAPAERAEMLAAAERIAATSQQKTPVIEPAETKIEAEQVLNCPKCKQEIPVPNGAETLFCCHCGQKIRIKD